METSREGLWFKRKVYGWGWTPITWQGWLIVFFYVGIIGFLISGIDERSSLFDIISIFILPTILLTVVFIMIAYKKGEKPRWQWGEKER